MWKGLFNQTIPMGAKRQSIVSIQQNVSIARLRAPGGDAFLAATQKSGVIIPSSPMAITLGEGLNTFWMRPTEWWIAGATENVAEVRKRFLDISGAHHFLLADMTHQIAVLRLSKRESENILKSGSTYPLSAARFPEGHYVRTRFAELAVLIHHTRKGYDFYVDQCVSRHLVEWLDDAALLKSSEF